MSHEAAVLEATRDHLYRAASLDDGAGAGGSCAGAQQRGCAARAGYLGGADAATEHGRHAAAASGRGPTL
eukprot:8604067-Pyramimonas_sp.AAC.1